MAGYGWDEEVQTSDSGFMVFEEGDYAFKVVDFERGIVKNGKNAGANQAIYTLRIMSEDGSSCEERYFIPLTDSLRWKATKFFKSIGAIPIDTESGSSIRFPWGEVIGKFGRCHVKPRAWTGNDGTERQSNEITACLVGDERTPAQGTSVAPATVDYGAL